MNIDFKNGYHFAMTEAINIITNYQTMTAPAQKALNDIAAKLKAKLSAIYENDGKKLETV